MKIAINEAFLLRFRQGDFEVTDVVPAGITSAGAEFVGVPLFRASLPFELGSIGSNTVHDRRDLACNRHLSFIRTNLLRELEPPTLER